MCATQEAGVISLPSDLKTRVASYLGYKDVVRLSSTCRAFHADIRLSSLSPPYELISTQDFDEVGATLIPFASPAHGENESTWMGMMGHEKGACIQLPKWRIQTARQNTLTMILLIKKPFKIDSPLVSPGWFTGLEFIFVPRKNEIHHM